MRKSHGWALSRERLEIASEPPESIGACFRKAVQCGELVQALDRALSLVTQVNERRVNILERDAVVGQGAHADQRIAKGIHGKAHQRQEIADFVALEQAAQMQNRNVARLKRGGDFIQAPVRAAKHRLIPQPHALVPQFLDGGGDALFFVFVAIELAQVKPLRAYAAIGGQGEGEHALGRVHVLREGGERIDDLLG